MIVVGGLTFMLGTGGTGGLSELPPATNPVDTTVTTVPDAIVTTVPDATVTTVPDAIVTTVPIAVDPVASEAGWSRWSLDPMVFGNAAVLDVVNSDGTLVAVGATFGCVECGPSVWLSSNGVEWTRVFTDPNACTIDKALVSFANWALLNDDIKHLYVWGNGAAFDNAILSTAYDICDWPQPWMFWNDRCYRTMKAQHRDVDFVRLGTYHNALDDAESQAEHLLAMEIYLE